MLARKFDFARFAASAACLAQPLVRRDQRGGTLADLEFKVVDRPRELALGIPLLHEPRRQIRALAVQVYKYRDLRLQDACVDGLDNVVDGPDFVPSRPRLRVVDRGRKKNDGGVAGALATANQRCRLEPVHHRHPDVHQDQGEIGPENLAQRVCSRPGRDHVPTGLLKQFSHRPQGVRVVVDDEDACHRNPQGNAGIS